MNIYFWFSRALLLASLGRVGEAVDALDSALAIQDVPEIRRLRDSLSAGTQGDTGSPGS